MFYIICYDVQEDKKRTQVMNFLKDHGYHLQKSVFIVDCAKPEAASRIYATVVNHIQPDTDRVFMAPLCNACITRRMVCGLPLDFQKPVWIV